MLCKHQVRVRFPSPPPKFKIMKFYAVSTGSYDAYIEYFITATCPEEAALKFLASEFMLWNEIGTIWDAELNKHGVLHTTTELCRVELVGPKGYVWNEVYNREHKASSRPICLLCGGGPLEDEGSENFVNEDGKCKDCAILKQVKI